MAGGSERTSAGREAFNTSQELSRTGYDIAIPALRRQQGILGKGLDQGEFGYLREAFDRSRGLLGENAASQEQAGIAAGRMGNRAAVAGGNLGAQQNFGQGYGQQLAQAMFSSRVNEAGMNVEQMDKNLGFMTGHGQQAASGAMGAMSNQLGAIGYMRNYDPTYANILAGLNAAGTVYGAGKTAGWFGTAPPPQGSFGGVGQGGQPYTQFSGGASGGGSYSNVG